VPRLLKILTGGDAKAALANCPRMLAPFADACPFEERSTYCFVRMTTERVTLACVALLMFACGHESKPSSSQSTSPPAPSLKPPVASPKRLTTMPVSAYQAKIAMDDDAVYLMTSNAAYRLVDGEAPQGLQLDLGVGPVMTRTAFAFWSKGAIWSAPKAGGAAREIAKLPHQPQYFVSSGEALAWVDQADDGMYTIQALSGRKPRVLVSSQGEIRALDMVGDRVYFVQRPADDSWRIGFVHQGGGEPQYGVTKKGRAPSQLTGSEAVHYYDLDTKRILRLSLNLREEEVELTKLVCSPIHVSTRIYCGCVEGLFDVSKDTHQPRVLVYNRPGSITSVTSNSKAVAWVVDVGADQLAVDFLPASEAEGPAPVP